MPLGIHLDDASRRAFDDLWEQQAGEKKWCQMVYTEHGLDAILGQRALGVMHPCVVDEHIDTGIICQDRFSGLPDIKEA